MQLLYFIAFILCTQGVLAEAPQNSISSHQHINDLEFEKTFDQLLLLMQKRLIIMHEVAKSKWNQHLPIEDKEREQQILSDLVEKTYAFGLDLLWIKNFFQVQMDAAKEIQKRDFAIWKKISLEHFDNTLSLKDELRGY